MNFLGKEINYNIEEGIVEFSQAASIDKLLEKFNMSDCRSVKTPMQPDLKLMPTTKRKPLDQPYRELIGSIMYLMLATRPDLCFAIAYLSRFQDKVDETHWNTLKNVLRFLKGSKGYKLTFKRSPDKDPLLGYVDSDYGRDTVDRKSTTGYVFEVFGSTVVWCSRKQQVVALSSTEAEYVAVSVAVCEAIWIKGVLQDLQVDQTTPITLYEDNQSCIKMAQNQETKRCKHIDVKHHHIRDKIETGEVDLKYIPTQDQKADLMTKPLAAPQFEKLIELIGMQIHREGV